jgi:hypothetical protein
MQTIEHDEEEQERMELLTEMQNLLACANAVRGKF